MNVSYNLDDITNSDGALCDNNIMNYFSYGLNILLTIATIYSEVSGLSKCKSNGIIDGMVKSVNNHIEKQNTIKDSLNIEKV